MVVIAGVSRAKEGARMCGGIAQSTVPFLHREISCYTQFFALLHCCSSSEGDISLSMLLSTKSCSSFASAALVLFCPTNTAEGNWFEGYTCLNLQMEEVGQNLEKESLVCLVLNERSIPGNLV